ncbi:MAG: hypothetical protein AB7O62_26455 [Pirellulales bacterium]
MIIVEQAIFTSARTGRGTGYHLAAASAGLSHADVRELSLTGPSHDSLWEQSPEAMSVNFHALPSGAMCVSQTTPEGQEYSERGGYRIYTHSLIVHPDDLRRQFANNPLELLRAALQQGALQVFADPPATLGSLELEGQAADVDASLHADWTAEIDRHRLAEVIDAVIATTRIGLASGPDSLRTVASVLGMLPVSCRAQMTFSTGLRYSPSRSFRVSCLDADESEVRRLQRSYGLSVFEPRHSHLRDLPPSESWGSYVAEALGRGDLATLAEALSQDRPGLTLEDLPELACCLAVCLPEPAWRQRRVVAANLPRGDVGQSAADIRGHQRTDGEHRAKPIGMLAAAVMPRVAATMDEPSMTLSRRFPIAVECLLRLEGIVFESLAGRPAAAAGMVEIWRELLHFVGRKDAAEVRELYMRYAITLWRELNHSDPQSSHQRGLEALEVLGILAEGAA